MVNSTTNQEKSYTRLSLAEREEIGIPELLCIPHVSLQRFFSRAWPFPRVVSFPFLQVRVPSVPVPLLQTFGLTVL
jgi:hypothetical protein